MKTVLGIYGRGRWGEKIRQTLERDFANRAQIAWQVGRTDLQRANLREVDAVVAAVPPARHYEIVESAYFEHGRPLMIEKPLALSPATANHIARRWTQRRLPLLVDHVHLFAPAYEQLKRVIEGHEIVLLRSLGGNSNDGPDRNEEWSVRPMMRPLWDYGPHDVAFALDLLGPLITVEVTDAFSEATTIDGTRALFDIRWKARNARVHLRFGNGMPAKRRQLEVLTHRGVQVLYDDLAEAKLTVNGLPVTDLDSTPPLTRALDVFLNAVRHGTPDPRLGPELGVEVVRTLQWIEAAILEGRGGGDG